MSNPWVIVKIGGSLYELPDLRHRLISWIAQLGSARTVLVPGGGLTAEAIRALDRVHRLGDEASHWLAIRALSVNARFLREFFPAAELLMTLPLPEGASGPMYILDAYPFFRADEQRNEHLPHNWHVTSDSLALRLAVLMQARELVLLKSVDWQGSDWNEASGANVVDAHFAQAVRKIPSNLCIRVVNLRDWQKPRGEVLRTPGMPS